MRRPSSRPLRALALVLAGWTGARMLILGAGPVPVQPVAAAIDVPAAARPNTVPVAPVQAAALTIAIDSPRMIAAATTRSVRSSVVQLALDDPQPVAPVLTLQLAEATPQAAPVPVSQIAPAQPLPPAPVAPGRKRISGSSWALLRGDGPAPLSGSGSLGGAQAGMRVFVEPGPPGLALTGRLSAPLSDSRGREASVGIGLRSRNAGLLVERRIAVGRGGRDAFSVTGYAGLWDVRLPARLRMNGYLQAGLVGLKSRDGFADGAIEIDRDLLVRDGLRLALGGGVWGGIQPDLRRLDLGPQASARFGVGPVGLRVAAGYRLRIAGSARPGSGPALAIGADF